MGAAGELLGAYQHVIESLTLRTGTSGVFDVSVDDEVLYSKHAEGRHARPGEVLERFRDLIGPDVARYGE